MKMTRTVAVAILSASALLSASAALAAEAPTTVKVRFGDLDPNQPRDAARLLRRFEAAALEACGASTFSLREYRDSIEHSACYRSSVARAVAAVNAPVVTNLYGAQTAALRLAAN